jgi:tetratricopeptide (TPR) repeat protein
VADFPAVPDYRHQLGIVYLKLGDLLKETRRLQEAEGAYRDAIAREKQLAAEFPNVPEYRQNVARSLYNLGNLLRNMGRRQEAETAYRDALTWTTNPWHAKRRLIGCGSPPTT